MFHLSVCAETIYCNIPIIERLGEIAKAGFAVDFWRWIGKDVDAIAERRDVRISSFSGYMTGSLVDPSGLATYLEGVEQTIPIAKKLRCRDLLLVTGEIGADGRSIHPVAAHPASRWITAYKGLCRIADLAEKHDVVYYLEPLNIKVDHPGYPLPYIEDAVRLIEQVGSPRIKLIFDIYHAQVQEGNICQLLRDFRKFLGYVHVADVPGRHEPGTGEIHWPQVVRTLREIGYTGTVAMEAFPEGDPQRALTRFREAFA